MRVLVVGGTGFLGGAITQAAHAAGYDVTTLSRRARAPNHISADRTQPLPDLHDRGFDWVFDTCAFTPDMVTHVLNAVGPDIGHYCMISSISAFSDMTGAGTTEAGPSRPATPKELALTPDHPTSAAAYGAAYGPLKKSCEDAATARLGDRAHLVRVGLLVGPGDNTDRMTWWVRRMDQGGKVPVPLPKDATLQMIDARDAAAYCIGAATRKDGGVVNLTGPILKREDVLNRISEMTGEKATLCWLPPVRFDTAGVAFWTDVPMMLSPDWITLAGMLAVDTTRAISRGLKLRPLDDTLRDILTWDRGHRTTTLTCGMSASQEAALLN
ncbi:NAD-dependent epimerase/dehydratase family protein [Octadecabacter sp. R77987]|uniref:NAD-dependent epimerase/dehydratase family protein n=1 Tax=Octadecabacter sp. R77987 TaxID=3093874 RepID=UPI00367271A8